MNNNCKAEAMKLFKEFAYILDNEYNPFKTATREKAKKCALKAVEQRLLGIKSIIGSEPWTENELEEYNYHAGIYNELSKL